MGEAFEDSHLLDEFVKVWDIVDSCKADSGE